jgi:sporadic carbohydrate cluster protein (TIGR04323 family)
MTNAHGYRGYNGSRAYSGLDFPQNVQNFLIRNYCQKYNLTYLLSASEYRMPGCYMILEEVLSSLDTIDGIVLFSIFMLPEDKAKRERIYKKVLDAGRTLHAALEDMAVTKWEDVQLFEDVLRLNMIARTDQCMEDVGEFLAEPAGTSVAA